MEEAEGERGAGGWAGHAQEPSHELGGGLAAGELRRARVRAAVHPPVAVDRECCAVKIRDVDVFSCLLEHGPETLDPHGAECSGVPRYKTMRLHSASSQSLPRKRYAWCAIPERRSTGAQQLASRFARC